ncbi:MAG: T9SS type A sorting domain-containing protein, partial [Saprospiraceae bacterium]|nr:T9SS type A sorting domain-containing protein [Saprospiraceae bacterium]
FELNGNPLLEENHPILHQEICTGKEAPFLDNLTIQIQETQVFKNDNNLVYPNPGSGPFYLNKELVEKIPTKINVWNTSGNLKKSIRVQSVTHEPLHLDLTELPAGMYWLEILFANYNPVKIAVFKW